MRLIDVILSLSAPAMLLAILVIFLYRGLYRRFPFFFSYVLYVLVADALRLSVMHRPLVYPLLYWITEAVYAVLALLVIFEIYRHLFPIEYHAFEWLRMLLAAIVLLILLLSCWEALKNPPEHGHIRQMVSFIFWFDLGVHALEGLLFLLVVLLRVILPVAWKRYEFGILIGLGLPAAVTTIADLLRFEHGSSYETLFRYAPPIAYILATIIWLHAFWTPPDPQTPRATLGEMEEMLRHDQEELRKINEHEQLAISGN
jgi:hypothetical protein